MTLAIVGVTFGIVGSAFGTICAIRLLQWERQLRGARIAIAYKGRVKLQAPLIDWLKWANSLDNDKTTTGRPIYKANATTVVILKRRPPVKAKTITRKGDSNVRLRPLHNLAQRRRATSTREVRDNA